MQGTLINNNNNIITIKASIKKKLKAILLAGGLGTRAKPFTDYSPKALIPIHGRPAIDHLARYLSKFSCVSEIIIICEFDSFGRQIINYFEGKEKIIGKRITFIEDKKKGTGGSILHVEESVKDDGFFLVWFADNLCALQLDSLVMEYNKIIDECKNQVIGMLVVRKKRHEETGRVILEDNNATVISLIKEFIEKPVITLECPESAGIYIFSNKIFDVLHSKSMESNNGTFDLSYDILAKIPSGGEYKLASYEISRSNTYWIDIESPAHIDRNRKTVDKIIQQMQSSVPDK
jgi:mannose-1-phosphate guanylyltransferase